MLAEAADQGKIFTNAKIEVTARGHTPAERLAPQGSCSTMDINQLLECIKRVDKEYKALEDKRPADLRKRQALLSLRVKFIKDLDAQAKQGQAAFAAAQSMRVAADDEAVAECKKASAVRAEAQACAEDMNALHLKARTTFKGESSKLRQDRVRYNTKARTALATSEDYKAMVEANKVAAQSTALLVVGEASSFCQKTVLAAVAPHSSLKYFDEVVTTIASARADEAQFKRAAQAGYLKKLTAALELPEGEWVTALRQLSTARRQTRQRRNAVAHPQLTLARVQEALEVLSKSKPGIASAMARQLAATRSAFDTDEDFGTAMVVFHGV